MEKLYVILWMIVLIFISIMSTFWTVSSWEIWIRYSYWVIKDTIKEWTYFNIPFIENVEVVDIKTQKLDVETNARSKDLQNVTTKLTLNYSVDPKLVMNLYRNIWEDFVARVITPSMQEAIKWATAKYTAEELVTKRELVKDNIKWQLITKLSTLWIKVEDVNITSFEFSSDFNNAVNQKVKAEQDALTQKNKLEQVKYEAQQQIEKAKAEAESIKIQAQSVSSQWWTDYVKLKWIEKWNWQLPTTSLWSDSNLLLNVK